MKEALTRILGHTEKRKGCWVWTRATDQNGYGRTNVAGQSMGAHRATYSLMVGPIPAGHHVHHVCQNKPCVNPTHLQPITPADHNRLRVRTHCLHGHEFDSVNTYRTPAGSRACRKCTARRQREYQARKKAALNETTPPERGRSPAYQSGPTERTPEGRSVSNESVRPNRKNFSEGTTS